MSDERPKKSWRDIDKQRDRSGGATPRRDKDEQQRDKMSQSAAYSKYKSQLDKLFKPGGANLPESMKEKLGPVSEDSKKNRETADALRKDPSAPTLIAYLETGQPLPDDPRLLTGLLDIKDEALVRHVLAALIAVVEGGKKPNRMLLIQRLQALENWAEEDDTKTLIGTLRAALE